MGGDWGAFSLSSGVFAFGMAESLLYIYNGQAGRLDGHGIRGPGVLL